MCQLDSFKPEATTLWSFPKRGDWATHSSKYRGNFAPQVPRNILLNYSDVGDLVLDPMVGSGTTLIECKLLGRNGIGIDINPEAIALTRQSLNFTAELESDQQVYVGDVRSLGNIKNESIDLICTHPPYMNIVQYSKGQIAEDLSNISNPFKFCDAFEPAILEMWRVLKPGHYCAILVGDTRKAQHYVPFSYHMMFRFMQAGFVLKEEIIKAQHNCIHSSKWQTKAKSYRFYLIMHEHLFVFRKPNVGEDLSRIRWSMLPERSTMISIAWSATSGGWSEASPGAAGAAVTASRPGTGGTSTWAVSV